MDAMAPTDDAAERPDPPAGSSRRRAVLRRVAILGACALTAWHVFATFLWVAPYSTIREAIPGGNTTLTSYMIPFFGQSWSVFAPEPINGNYAFRVRAEVKTADGTLSQTDWVDAAAVDLSMSRENLFPPRAANLGVQEASRFKDAWDALSVDHRIIVALDFYTGEDWRDRLQQKLTSYGDPKSVVEPYITQELYATTYATQVAKATWGQGVTRVQFQASRQNIPTFTERHLSVAAPAVQIAETGWRPAIVLPGQNEAHFADVFADNLRHLGVQP